ncbi:MAG: GNAT family N-acetyltransferase [Deltaproteobacteria bacterium]|nr:GNAT family N-acetyltransferase [Deltaproteobacteria bacterium]NCP03329.1 GNAT family N-acetyltransferase [Deltaproteobacteria bacterium]
MRTLKPDDLPQLAQLLAKLAAQGSFTTAEVSCALELLQIVIDQPAQQDYLVLVAEKAGIAVGYVLYGPVPLTSGNFDVYWIATDPAVQGDGYGRRLMEAAEEDMCRRGARMICLETSSQGSYARTRSFYDNAGYTQESVIADFYVPGDDRITYVKRFS